MSDTPRSPSRPTSFPPGPTVTVPAALYLRAEHAQATDPQQRALLLHELGVVEERGGDEMGAAREFLAAFNSFAQFREPLEGLVRLLERRKSVKNLPKLLDALLRAADTVEERTRAQLKRAGFLADYKRDDQAAMAALEHAIRESPEDATLWLELEVLAGRAKDSARRADALAARAESEKDPTWRALLLLGVADLMAKRGEGARAIQILEQATALEGSGRYRAAQALERQAARDSQPRPLAQALEAQAELVVTALRDAASGDALGVPANLRIPEAAADAWLRAAEVRRYMGELGAAGTLLDRALERVGSKAPILAARLSLAEAAGDMVTAERIAETLLDQGLTGPSAASLWMRVAEAAAQRDDAPGALAALSNALKEDPGCIPARALQIDLLGGGGDGAALAGALEAMANELPTDAGKGRTFLLAAYVYALHARDLPSAKTALSQAGASEVGPGLLARTARFLATLMGEPAWYEEATRRLLAAGALEREQASLWFELGRTRLLRRDEEGAAKAFDSLAQAPMGGWLGRALGAYALGHTESAEKPSEESNDAVTARVLTKQLLRAEALDRLREVETDAAAARALGLAAARRADLSHDLADACARTREVFEADPTDPVAAVYLSELEKRAGRPIEAARALARTAKAVSDENLATQLEIEAAALFFAAGDRVAAIEELEAGFVRAPGVVSPLLAWALRSTPAGSSDRQRKFLDRAIELAHGKDRELIALERSALEVLSGQVSPTGPLFADAGQNGKTDLGNAAALGRILVAASEGENGAYAATLARLSEASVAARPLVAWESLRIARLRDHREVTAISARTLAESLPTPAAQLEWIGAAMAEGDVASEVRARRALAGSMTDEARAALLADAALIALLDGSALAESLLPGEEISSRLMNLELAPPGERPSQRAAALRGLGDTLGEDTKLEALVMAGYNLLARGDAKEALACFQKVVGQRAGDLFAWEGVRSAAEALGEAEPEAEACASLGELCTDHARAATFYERAAFLRLDQLSDPVGGELALERAFSRDASRTAAFDRLFRRVRERGESEKLLALIARRLQVAEEPDELSKLYWERARALRQTGDRVGALAALEHVAMIEPDHVGALALKGEIEITQGNFAAAAESLSQLAMLAEAPQKQRLLSGVAAVDLYENKLNDTARALEVLIGLYDGGLANLPVRERMARAAAKVGSWDRATLILEELMHERATPEGRIEAARLCMAIYRDKLGQPLAAEGAVTRLLDEAPEDAEALELLLAQPYEAEHKLRLLSRGRSALVEVLAEEAVDEERTVRLAKIAEELEDWPLRQATLGVLSAIRGPNPEIERELSLLDARVARMPQVAVDATTIGMIGDPDDTGPLAELFAVLAEPLAQALGPSLEGLGVGKKQRVEPRAGLPIRNEIAAWAGALGLGEFELYLGGKRDDGVQAVPGEVPALVVGPAIKAPLAPAARQAIARELYALRRGTSVTRSRDDTTVAAIVVAACRLAEVRVEAPPYAMLADVQRQLGKALSRRTKKVLPALCRAVVEEGRDSKAWAQAAQASMYRMAAIAAGDVSLVLRDMLEAPPDRLPALIPYDQRARRLITFVLSPRYLELRGKLGMGVT